MKLHHLVDFTHLVFAKADINNLDLSVNGALTRIFHIVIAIKFFLFSLILHRSNDLEVFPQFGSQDMLIVAIL